VQQMPKEHEKDSAEEHTSSWAMLMEQCDSAGNGEESGESMDPTCEN